MVEPADPKVSYNGLMNHGATCYLNSVLQVLFMTEDFREAVNSHSNHMFIDNHLKDLFDRLKIQISDTFKILKVLDINTVNQQQDAAEYCQKILKLTSPEAAKIFHAELTNRRFCSSCETETDTDESFWILPLSLVDSSNEVYSVEDGIKEFFKESYFIGEDQMYCEHCDTKVDARTKYVVKHHPEVLILLLKRFDFSYRYMTYVKINDRVDVATTLKIPKNQTYELYAVVDHVGDLRSGHYTSRIRSQVDDGWYQFNDTWVTKIADNINICSAGSKTAFLLFYRKKDTSLKESTNSHNHHPTPKPKDEAKNQNNDQINIEDTTLSASYSPNHQKICVPDNPDPAERNGDEDMRRRSNRDEPEDRARIKHKEDKTLKKPKRSKTKKKKHDVDVGELSEEIKKPPAHDEPKTDVLKKPAADLKQHSKMYDVRITGLQIELQSTTANGNNAPNPGELDGISVIRQVESFLQSKGISLDVNNIITCYTIPEKQEPNKPVIIVSFKNQQDKQDLLKQKQKLKETEVYMREQLTKKKAEIARNARHLKKQKRILDTWVKNNKIYIKLNGPAKKVKVVNNMEDFVRYLGIFV